MLFSKLAAVATFAICAFAAPISLGLNTNNLLATSTDGVNDILSTLQTDLQPILAGISTYHSSYIIVLTSLIADLTSNGVEDITGEAVITALAAVNDVIGTATGALNDLNVHASVLNVHIKRVPAVDEAAKLTAYILTVCGFLSFLPLSLTASPQDVLTAVNTLKGAPLIEDLLPGVDGTLANLVGGVNTILGGVVSIVSPL
jgi:hypothetical protein